MDKKVYDAVKKIDPFKSDEIAARYEKLTFQLDSAIASELIYTDEHNNYKAILSQLEYSANMLVSHAESMMIIDKEGSLSDFLQELDYVSQSLMGDPNMLLLSESPTGLETIDNEFNSIEAALSHLGIGYKLDNYKTEYLSVPSENRVSITKLSTSFEEIYRKSNNSGTSLAYLSNSTNKIYTALGNYVAGSENAAAADTIMEEVNTRLDNIKEVEDFSAELNKIGIKGLNLIHTEFLMDVLKDEKITTKKALNILSKIKEKPEFYGDITKIKLPEGDLTEFLIIKILEYTKGDEGKYRVKHTIFIENQFSINTTKLEKKAPNLVEKIESCENDINEFKNNYAEFSFEAKDYANKNPKAKKFPARIENKITEQLNNYVKVGKLEINFITVQRDVKLNQLKYELSNQYLNKKGVKATWKETDKIIKELWSIKDSSKLEEFSKKHKINAPSLFNLVFILENRIKTKKSKLSIKNHMSSKIEAGEFSPTLLYSYFDFLNTGKFDRTGTSTRVHLAQWSLEIHSELVNYEDLFTKLDEEWMIISPILNDNKSLKDIPENQRDSVMRRIQSYFLLSNEFKLSAGKLNGLKLTLEQLSKKNTYKGDDKGLDNLRIYISIDSQMVYFTDKRNSGMITVDETTGKFRKKIDHNKSIEITKYFEDNMNLSDQYDTAAESESMIAAFITGQENGPTPSKIADVSKSPIHTAVVQNRIAHYGTRLDKSMMNMFKRFDDLSTKEKRWDSPSKLDARKKRYVERNDQDFYQDMFDTRANDYQYVIRNLRKVRGNIVTIRDNIQSELDDHSIYEEYPFIKEQREAALKAAIKNLDLMLTSNEGPISISTLTSLEQAVTQLEAEKSKYEHQESMKYASMAFIFAFAVATAVIGGWAFGTGAAFLGGTGAGTSVFGTGLGLKVFVTVAGAAGAAGGVTIGSRLAMESVDAFGWQDAPKDLWDKDKMLIDFGKNFALSLAIIGVAGVAVKGLEATAAPRAAWLRTLDQTTKTGEILHKGSGFLTKVGQGGLNKLTLLRTLSNPSSLFLSSSNQAAKGSFSRMMGARYGIELGQETMEEVAQAINPYLGGVLMVINASDGVSMNTNVSVSMLESVSLAQENGKLVYTSVEPNVFIEKYRQKLNTEEKLHTVFAVNLDNSVIIETIPYGKHKATRMIITPSVETNLQPDAEVARIMGKQKEISSIPQLVAVSTELKTRGFIVKQEGSKLVAQKGGELIDINFDNNLQIDSNFLSQLNNRIHRATAKTNPEVLTSTELETMAVSNPAMFEALILSSTTLDMKMADVDAIFKAQHAAGIEVNYDLKTLATLKTSELQGQVTESTIKNGAKEMFKDVGDPKLRSQLSDLVTEWTNSIPSQDARLVGAALTLMLLPGCGGAVVSGALTIFGVAVAARVITGARKNGAIGSEFLEDMNDKFWKRLPGVNKLYGFDQLMIAIDEQYSQAAIKNTGHKTDPKKRRTKGSPLQKRLATIETRMEAANITSPLNIGTSLTLFLDQVNIMESTLSGHQADQVRAWGANVEAKLTEIDTELQKPRPRAATVRNLVADLRIIINEGVAMEPTVSNTEAWIANKKALRYLVNALSAAYIGMQLIDFEGDEDGEESEEKKKVRKELEKLLKDVEDDDKAAEEILKDLDLSPSEDTDSPPEESKKETKKETKEEAKEEAKEEKPKPKKRTRPEGYYD